MEDAEDAEEDILVLAERTIAEEADEEGPQIEASAAQEDAEEEAPQVKVRSIIRKQTYNIVSTEDTWEAIGNLRYHLIERFESSEGVIKVLDKNGDRTVSFTELETGLRELEVPLDELLGIVPLKRAFKELDIDGGGDLSLEELLNTNPWLAEEEAVLHLRKALEAHFGSKWDIIAALDDDKSGTISYGELDRTLKLHGINIMQTTGGVDLGRIYDLLDTDCSGELSFDELLDGDPRKAASARDEAIMGFRAKILQIWGTEHVAMSALDTNGNGLLSYSELKSGLERSHIALRQFLGKKDFRWLFRVLDVDGSGQISAQELVAFDPKQEAIKMAERRRKRAAQRKPQKQQKPAKPVVPTPAPEEPELDPEELRLLKAQMKKLQKAHAALEKKHQQLQEEHDKLVKEHKQLQDDHEQLKAEHTKLRQEYAQLKEDHDRLRTEHDELLDRYRDVEDARNKLKNEFEELQSRYDQKVEENRVVSEQLRQVKEQYAELEASHAKVQELNRTLQEELRYIKNDLVKDHEILKEKYKKLLDEHEELESKHTHAKKDHSTLQETHKKFRLNLTAEWDFLSTPPPSPHRHMPEPGSPVYSMPQRQARPFSAFPISASESTLQDIPKTRTRPASAFPDVLDPQDESSSLRMLNSFDERPGSGAGIRNRNATLRGQVLYVDEMAKTWQNTLQTLVTKKNMTKARKQDTYQRN